MLWRGNIPLATVKPTSDEHAVWGSAHTTRPHILQWCLLNVQANSCWQKGHFGTVASSSQVMTDCSSNLRWLFCPVRFATDIVLSLELMSSGRLVNSFVRVVSRFSSRDTSRF